MSFCSSVPVRPSRAASTKIVGLPALISVASIVPTPGTSSGSIAVAGREHRAALALAVVVRRIEEFELHLGGGKRHAVELEVAQLLHRAVLHRHVRDDPLLMLACQMRTVAVPSRRRLRRGPCSIANGPTAVERLPQLPDQSMNGASIDTWPNR